MGGRGAARRRCCPACRSCASSCSTCSSHCSHSCCFCCKRLRMAACKARAGWQRSVGLGSTSSSGGGGGSGKGSVAGQKWGTAQRTSCLCRSAWRSWGPGRGCWAHTTDTASGRMAAGVGEHVRKCGDDCWQPGSPPIGRLARAVHGGWAVPANSSRERSPQPNWPRCLRTHELFRHGCSAGSRHQGEHKDPLLPMASAAACRACGATAWRCRPEQRLHGGQGSSRALVVARSKGAPPGAQPSLQRPDSLRSWITGACSTPAVGQWPTMEGRQSAAAPVRRTSLRPPPPYTAPSPSAGRPPRARTSP